MVRFPASFCFPLTLSLDIGPSGRKLFLAALIPPSAFKGVTWGMSVRSIAKFWYCPLKCDSCGVTAWIAEVQSFSLARLSTLLEFWDAPLYFDTCRATLYLRLSLVSKETRASNSNLSERSRGVGTTMPVGFWHGDSRQCIQTLESRYWNLRKLIKSRAQFPHTFWH